MNFARFTVLIVSLAALSGCAKSPPPAKEYVLKGEVLKVDPAGQLITVNGEKIEGWMDAMKMEYPVKDKQEFQKLKVGDRVTAKVVVQGTDYWLAGVTDTVPAPADSK